MPVEKADAISLLKKIHLFRGLDEPKISAGIEFFETIEFPAGTLVFQQGDDPDFFYIVHSGRLKISRYRPETRQSHQIGFLEEGDYFGQELLAEDWPRQITVEAETDVVLLRLDVPNFKALLDALPIITPRLQLVLDSYRLMLNTRFVWLDPEEFVYYIARRHILFLFTRLLPPIATGMLVLPPLALVGLNSVLGTTSLILLAVALLGILGWLVWAWVDWSNDYYIITNRRVIYQERVVLLYDSRQESPMDAVQSTSITTSQLGRILGYGNVAIRTYIGTILFRSVPSPEQVMGIVQEQQLRAQTSQRRAELRQMETLIERKIGYAPPPPVQTSKPPTQVSKPTAMQQFLSDLLHLRYEIGGTILYRTHWFILLQKILVPSLFLLGLLALWIMRLVNLFDLISLGATTGLVFLAGLMFFSWWLYQYLDWHNDVYLITQDQIVDVNKKPLGKEERRAAPIKNILSIEYQRLGIIGLVLNYGTVYIRVGDQQLTFDDVYNPSEVQRELFNRLSARTYAEKQAAQEGERQRLTEWIAAYHRVSARNQSQQNPPAQGRF